MRFSTSCLGIPPARTTTGPFEAVASPARVAERLQEIPQRGGEASRWVRRARRAAVLGVDMVGQGLVDERATVVGESDVHAAAVCFAGGACHQAATLEAVEALGDGPRGDHGRPHQLGGGQAVLRSAAAQGGEHIERGGVEPVRTNVRRSSASINRESLDRRPITAIGDTSRSGRCVPHCSSTRST